MYDTFYKVYKVRVREKKAEETIDGSMKNYETFVDFVVGDGGVKEIKVDPYHGVIEIHEENEKKIIKEQHFTAFQDTSDNEA